jgi:hypothetical protein
MTMPMKIRAIAAFACFLSFFPSCGKKEEAPEITASQEQLDLKAADTPILPVRTGDWWKYKVSVEVPPGITSEGAAAVEIEHQKTRTYIGKVSPGEGRPEVDAFDVSVPGQALERELVEIHDDRVMMRGTERPDTPGVNRMWLETAIPFVVAGMRPGMEMRPFSIKEGSSTRVTKVIARESVEVPAGNFPCVRLLMTGNDGELEVRRTTWFSPGIGIVKEEKTRYAGEKLVFRESTSLVETNLGK